MATFQYKSSSGGTWTDIPKTAYHGTFEGSLDVVYPEPQARTGLGRPTAAIGEPIVQLKSKVMTASGMQWWQSMFSSSNSLDAEFWLTARDTRSNNWKKYTGYLIRPAYSRVQIGTGSLSTLFYDVEINLEFAVETS